MREEIELNGKVYVKKESSEKFPLVMVRTYSAGVFFGRMESREGKEVKLLEAVRVWRWAGAATLSQLATSGTSKPSECQFPEPVKEVILTEAIEIISITNEAYESLKEVPIWKE